MKELVLNGADWATSEDVYDAFFSAVGAPSWRGRNLNAMADSIAGGQINQLEVPYRLVIQNYNLIGSAARDMTDNFVNLVRELAGKGCPVEVFVEGQ